MDLDLDIYSIALSDVPLRNLTTVFLFVQNTFLSFDKSSFTKIPSFIQVGPFLLHKVNFVYDLNLQLGKFES